jgi:hypothetical protein
MRRLAESAGRWLEPVSNDRPRGMVVQDRTRLIDPLFHFQVISIAYSFFLIFIGNIDA